MPKIREDYTSANRIAWNEAASRHAAHNNATLFEAFNDPDYVTFEGDILETLLQVGVKGKSISSFAVTMVVRPYRCVTWGQRTVLGLTLWMNFWRMARR
jgi:hypothetical protein